MVDIFFPLLGNHIASVVNAVWAALTQFTEFRIDAKRTTKVKCRFLVEDVTCGCPAPILPYDES